ncbi:MAG: ABC transporter permease, partial [Kiloniellales bacterium]
MDGFADTAPRPRRFGAVNWRGLWSFYQRNVLRFFRFALEQIAGPAVSSLLFLTVFDLALDGAREVAPGITLSQFIAPGIVIFSMIHSAFENAAAYIVYDKLDGMIGDILSAPLKPFEIVAGYALAAVTSALSTGAVVLVLMVIFVDLPL